MTEDVSKWPKLLILIGAVLIGVGLLAWALQGRAGSWLGWLGRLPGDIRIEREHFRFYAPITTMILLSLLLNLILRFLQRWM